MAEWKTCPVCGGELHPTARRCRHCGERITPEALAEREAHMKAAVESRQAVEAEELLKNLDEESAFGTYALSEPTPPLIPPSTDSIRQSDRIPTPYNDVDNKCGFFRQYFVKTFFTNYSNAMGMASRRNYWLSMVAYWVIDMLIVVWLGAISAMLNTRSEDQMLGLGIIGVIIMAFMILMIVPSVCLNIRRMHNIGQSGWMVLLGYVPIVNIYYLVLTLTKGKPAYDTGSRFKFSDILVILLLVIGISVLACSVPESNPGNLYNLTTEWTDNSDSTEIATEYPVETVDEYSETVEPVQQVVAPRLDEVSEIGYDDDDDVDYDFDY